MWDNTCSKSHDAAFRAQHQALVKEKIPNEKGDEKSVLINYAECPVGRLYVKKDKNGKRLITRRQLLAAQLLRQDFENCHVQQQLTSRYDGVPISGGMKGSATQELAIDFNRQSHQRYRQALEVVGTGLSDVLIRVCCHLEGIVDAEKALQWPARSGKLVLKIALDRLADFYEERGAL